MRCPFCQADKASEVKDSRACDGGRSIRRRRQCQNCGKRFTTYERVEQTTRLMVIKKDGRRLPWDREKILAGLERACFKRPVREEQLLHIRDEVEEEVFSAYDREVPSAAIGELVTDKLRRVDQVAYVRFASVYKRFKTLEELVEEAQAVIDARRYEDPPGQGRLFVEDVPARPGVAAGASNGHNPAGEISSAPAPREGEPTGAADTAAPAKPRAAARGRRAVRPDV